MIGDDVKEDLDSLLVEIVYRGPQLIKCSEDRVDVEVVRDIVAMVALGRRVCWVEPNGVNAQGREVSDLRPETLQVPNPIPITIEEGAPVHLVDDCRLPCSLREHGNQHHQDWTAAPVSSKSLMSWSSTTTLTDVLLFVIW